MDSVVASYSDFQGLAKLRAKAQKDEMAAATEVAQQFEAFFVRMMLKSMRDASSELKSGLWDSSAAESYEEMFDAELSTSLARTQGFGITNWLTRQINDPVGAISFRRAAGVSDYQSLASVK